MVVMAAAANGSGIVMNRVPAILGLCVQLLSLTLMYYALVAAMCL